MKLEVSPATSKVITAWALATSSNSSREPV